MADPMTGPAPRCQWCSAPLPAPDLPTCPSCGATLTSTATEDIKGVTTLDPEAILRARAEVSRPRSRLISFITGEAQVDVGGEAEQAAIAAPDDAVRREMLRLQIEAERADLEAEAVALKTDAVVEQGIDLSALTDADEAGVAVSASPESTAPAATAPASTVPTAMPAGETAVPAPRPPVDEPPPAPPPPPRA